MRFGEAPLVVSIIAVAAAGMLAPAMLALSEGAFLAARAFLYSGLAGAFVAALLGVTLRGAGPRETGRQHLLTVVLVMLLLPVYLALPVKLTVDEAHWSAVFFEMSAALTTTGATIFTHTAPVPDAVHLWRGLCGWGGGFLVLVAALGIMAPLDIGGFEFRKVVDGTIAGENSGRGHGGASRDRIWRISARVAPVYVSVTALLFMLLAMSGQGGLDAALHAMAVISTSGITASAEPIAAEGGFLVEVMIAVFLVLSATVLLYDPTRRRLAFKERTDPELALLFAIVAALTVLLWVRHFLSAEALRADDFVQAIQAVWGTFFTVLSYLTTTGVPSVHWTSAQAWSGLETPGLILMALAAVGGGVASTAGGVKLFRVYALYKHGLREMERLTLPNSVAGAGTTARRIRREGAFIAWVFTMLFLVAIAGVMLSLSLVGLDFVTALQLAVMMLSNTGGDLSTVLDRPVVFGELDVATHGLLIVAMTVGRLEVLAIIAIVDPWFWRD